MNARKIVRFPHKFLSMPTHVWDFNHAGPKEEIHLIRETLVDSLKAAPNGLALAANQVGIIHRMFLIKPSLAEQYRIPDLIVNPVIRQFGENSVTEQEGCLSFPGVFIELPRWEAVVCDFQDIDGYAHKVILEDIGARCFQHEVEHLDGKVFIDNLDRIKRFQIRGKMMKNR